jgi:hypothetical protein
MNTAAIILFILLAAILVVLFTGVGFMVKGGDMNKKHSNKLMIARVSLQGLALAVLGALFLMSK